MTARHLTAASIDLDPLARLAEAAEAGPDYVLQNVGEVDKVRDIGGDYGDDEMRHMAAVTPTHEAGHAVVMTLAGDRVTVVYGFNPFWPNGGAMARTPGRGRRQFSAMLDEDGLARTYRTLVSTYAGPVAELRLDPRRVADGMAGSIIRGVHGDKMQVKLLAKALDDAGLGERYDVQDAAWAEAIRTISDPIIWAAVSEVADKLNKSRAFRPTVSGATVRKIVAKHLPAGWNWPGVFAGPVPELIDPPRAARRRHYI